VNPALLITLALLTLTLVGLAAVGIPMFLRRRRHHPSLPSHLHPHPDPLIGHLARQITSPPLRPGTAVLLPIFAFDVYPPRLRLIYDDSRALDAALLDLLITQPDRPPLRAAIQASHDETRRVRRDLLCAWMEGRGLDEPTLHELERRLAVVDERLSAGLLT